MRVIGLNTRRAVAAVVTAVVAVAKVAEEVDMCPHCQVDT
jgi:hypothetical protein